MALLWNFHPFCRKKQSALDRCMYPFEQWNGFPYHESWVRHLLIAPSLNGRRLLPSATGRNHRPQRTQPGQYIYREAAPSGVEFCLLWTADFVTKNIKFLRQFNDSHHPPLKSFVCGELYINLVRVQKWSFALEETIDFEPNLGYDCIIGDGRCNK
jgi:hypothetical protein